MQRKYKPQRTVWHWLEQGRMELADGFGSAQGSVAKDISQTSPRLDIDELKQQEKEPKPKAPEKNHNDIYFSP